MKTCNNMLVTVCVVTYNQEKWIRQTLESIMAQETDYLYEVIIGEDHGTDGTRAICQKYADKYENVILLPSSSNVGVTANWIQCIQAGTGKYIMTCAGDDWWHNPNKIQLQVDFMEKHPECVLSHTDFDEYREDLGTTRKSLYTTCEITPPQGRIQSKVLSGKDQLSALTSCIRRDAFEKYIPVDEFVRRRFPREDWPTYMILSAHGDVLYQPVSTATYRVGQESITRTSDYETVIKRAQKDKEMVQYIYSLFPQLGPFRDDPYYDGHHIALLAAYRNNDYRSAHTFAKIDTNRKMATYMAYTWFTFKLFRYIQSKRRKL